MRVLFAAVALIALSALMGVVLVDIVHDAGTF